MKRFLKHIIIILPLFAVCFFLIFSFADKTKTIYETEVEYQPRVYVTQYGEKYHSSGCHYLHSRIAKSLEEAQRLGYDACSYCHGTPSGTIAVEKRIEKTVDDTPAAIRRSAIVGAIVCAIAYLVIWGLLSQTNYYGERQTVDRDSKGN